MALMDPQEQLRYSRHFLLPEIGEAGQAKLKQARVLLIGMGGLGSPCALYLTAAGLGCLGIVDHDQVDLSNLQRQILYDESDVGQSKIKQSLKRLRAMNSAIQIVTHEEKLNADNALDLFKSYDLIIDGTDNFLARYLINDAAFFSGKAVVSASILAFEGQLAVFNYRQGPCYRCLYPEPPPAKAAPNCSENGVLGVLPGIMGTLQATEALKMILGIGEVLSGALLYVDALSMDFQKLKHVKNKNCPLCGPKASIRTVMPEKNLCAPGRAVPEISCEEVRQKLKAGENFLLLDVRTPEEVKEAFIEGSQHIILNELKGKLQSLDKKLPIVTYCKSGARSAQAAQLLIDQGFSAQSMQGGILQWKKK